MPLLDIVGIGACQRSFCVAFAFLSGEEEADFNWALTQLRVKIIQREWKSGRSSIIYGRRLHTQSPRRLTIRDF
ncbi:Secreted beta-glucosidase sun1 [Fusarium oxysporum f. sp. albedinis]|nr:Secreted beta-glucosidase sun1 [Fusarium oxysporum f. sp. albedinis]